MCCVYLFAQRFEFPLTLINTTLVLFYLEQHVLLFLIECHMSFFLLVGRGVESVGCGTDVCGVMSDIKK